MPAENRHAQLIREAIPLWYATMAWAKELLVRTYDLATPNEILQIGRAGENREKQIPGTNWFFKTHGLGIDIYKATEVGGIDFDFDKPDPDVWRLKRFILKQIADGQLSYEKWREFEDDEELFDRVIKEVLGGA